MGKKVEESETAENVPVENAVEDSGVVKRKKGKKKKNKKNVEPKAVSEKERTKMAVSYLNLWKNDRNSWKFNKMQQLFLIKNMYVKKCIGKSDFKILLEYLEGCQGGIRERLRTEAKDIVDNYGEEDEEKERESEEKGDRTKYKRAVKVLHILS